MSKWCCIGGLESCGQAVAVCSWCVFPVCAHWLYWPLAVQVDHAKELEAEAAAGRWLSDPALLNAYETLKLDANAKTSRLNNDRSTASTRSQVLQQTYLALFDLI
jgi:hypothetical protein